MKIKKKDYILIGLILLSGCIRNEYQSCMSDCKDINFDKYEKKIYCDGERHNIFTCTEFKQDLTNYTNVTSEHYISDTKKVKEFCFEVCT